MYWGEKESLKVGCPHKIWMSIDMVYLVMVVTVLGRVVDTTDIDDNIHLLHQGVISGTGNLGIRIPGEHLEQSTG